MKAVVLAAGEGTRLRPLTEDKPKAMVEVADRPILTDCFDRLLPLDADKLFVVVGYMKVLCSTARPKAGDCLISAESEVTEYV